MHNKKGRTLFFLLMFTISHVLVALAGELPDPALTPGATNPDVTQENIHQTICVRGFTKKIRPPAYYTNRLKKLQMREYGYQDTNPKNYEEDHLINLSIGGFSSCLNHTI